MLGNYRVSLHLGASPVVLSSIQLVSVIGSENHEVEGRRGTSGVMRSTSIVCSGRALECSCMANFQVPDACVFVVSADIRVEASLLGNDSSKRQTTSPECK
jgi:hypothetical protein